MRHLAALAPGSFDHYSTEQDGVAEPVVCTYIHTIPMGRAKRDTRYCQGYGTMHGARVELRISIAPFFVGLAGGYYAARCQRSLLVCLIFCIAFASCPSFELK
jgi:hypothetical protein